ncbi:fungal fucose-specific lectin [Aspergillus cavernicola]|uniref:Fucose-specific lectin n=1 Tax=Aspergillus cavernicola TaxID=176166 RepID=A0ABR4HBI2_9EURO
MSTFGAQQIRFRCAIAAVNFSHNIRIYSQDTSGGIREVACDNGNWSDGSEREVISYGILGSPIAAICKNMIHIFYIGEGNMVKEICRDAHGRWHEGELNRLKIQVAQYSMLCACPLAGTNNQMRLYVQMVDNNIQEYGCDNEKGGWSKMASKMAGIGRALPGTGMACTSKKDREMCIRLFCQDDQMNIIENCCRDGKRWGAGKLSIEKALPRTDLTATSCSESEVRLYYIDRDNRIKEMACSSDRWGHGQFDQPCVSGSQVAAVSWGNERDCNIRVYFQCGQYVTAISEWTYNRKWEEGKTALPPA